MVWVARRAVWVLGTVLLHFACLSAALGQTSGGLCENLARFSCAPGEYYDGTGKAQNSSVFNDRLSQVKEETKSLFIDRYRKALADPAHNYFKKAAMSALGLAHSPSCQSDSEAEAKKCLNDLATGVADIAYRRVFENEDRGKRITLPNFEKDLGDYARLTYNEVFIENLESLSTEAYSKLINERELIKIRDVTFPDIKKRMIKKIEQLADPKHRAELVEKVTAISWDPNVCLSKEANTQLSVLLVPNAFYEQYQNGYGICNGLLMDNNSDFLAVHAIAHELSHSIDPCGLASGPSDYSFKYSKGKNQEEIEREFPFKGVIECLRGQDSAYARRKIQFPLMSELSPEGAPAPPLGENNQPGQYPRFIVPEPKPFSFCSEDDQINDSFADWLAAEIVPEYIRDNYKGNKKLDQTQYRHGYSNIFRGSCEDRARQTNKWDEHPRLELRVDAIILTQPLIREQMGCKDPHPKYVHCSTSKKPAESNRVPAGLKPPGKSGAGGIW